LLRQKFEQELPPILSGLDAVGIQDESRKAIDEVLAILHGAVQIGADFAACGTARC
jgi:hypothetical protein